MLSTSPGRSRSVGRGGRVVGVGVGIAGGGGVCAVPFPSTSVNGNCACSALAAFLISEPVGPLTGRLAQPGGNVAATKMGTVPQSAFRRRGKQAEVMDERALGFDSGWVLSSAIRDWQTRH